MNGYISDCSLKHAIVLPYLPVKVEPKFSSNIPQAPRTVARIGVIIELYPLILFISPGISRAGTLEALDTIIALRLWSIESPFEMKMSIANIPKKVYS